MGFLLDSLDLAKLNAQRDIVKNERRQGLDNQPYGRAFEILAQTTYPASHPYSWEVIGSMEDLSAATEEDVKSFFRLYYAPNNAFLSIVGDFDPAQAKAWVQKYFAEFPARQADYPAECRTGRRSTPNGAWSSKTASSFRDCTSSGRPSARRARTGSRWTCLAAILSGPRTARLTKALVYDKQSAASVSVNQSTNEDVGDFQMIIVPRPGNSLTDLEQAADADHREVQGRRADR